jgi:hypothetical protein
VTVLDPPGPFETLLAVRASGTTEIDSTALADSDALKRFLANLVRGAGGPVAASLYRPRLDGLLALLSALGANVDADPIAVKLDG